MKTPHSSANRWYWLLLIPCIAMLAMPLYNRVEPRLLGFPFFYWYQFLWVVLSSLITAVVYRKVRTGEEEEQP
jgi:membrane protein implicated in regulation of membrane protease activity